MISVVKNLKQEIIPMVKNLIQPNMHGAEMILNYIHGELKQKRTRSMMTKDEFLHSI